MTRIVSAAVLVVFALGAARADEEKVPLDKLPKPVLDAAKKRFPKAEVKGASKETEKDKTVYEVTFKQDGRNIDVTLTPDGAITLIEQEVTFGELPKPVAETFAKKYPGAKYTIIESVTEVKDGKEALTYYEAHFTTKDGKAMEATVDPAGKFKAEAEDKEAKPAEKKGK